jgi:hypothetical protein
MWKYSFDKKTFPSQPSHPIFFSVGNKPQLICFEILTTMSYDEAVHGKSAPGFQDFETVKIPDLFLSFIAQPVPVNPLYEQAFAESVIWFAG